MQVGRCLFAQCPARTRSLGKGQGALPEGCTNDVCPVYKQANTEVCVPAHLRMPPNRPALPKGGAGDLKLECDCV